MKKILTGLAACSMLLLLSAAADAQDVVEFLTGARVEGKVESIDQTKKLVTFAALIGGRSLDRVYTYSQIHAVTYQGKRYVLNPKTDAPSAEPAKPDAGTGRTTASPAKVDVKSIIGEAGRTPPDWYNSTPLDYPPTLDLSWPEKPPGGWNSKKNMGQYVWSEINPNPSHWRGGVKLLHHLLAMHKDNAEVRTRVIRSLGNMYFNLFQDYARAAFWWEHGGVGPTDRQAVSLAECYFRLGDRAAAEAFLHDPDRSSRTPVSDRMIKLWADMGETDKAVKLARLYVRSGGSKFSAYLFAGDACRTVGRFKEAMAFYQEVIDSPNGSYRYADRDRTRARNNLDAVRRFELFDISKVADGTYTASSRGYEDEVHVEARVAKGRLESLRVTKHKEKQFYSSLTDVPQQIVEKQAVQGVDATSGATITAEAIINATAKALSQ
ncbi:FMN-binding protein [Lignipirellula cremea]|uniref:FMN-binding domain protein n=1 Tax=Lignipirellula cremea TaxID=2528010 RepID=A0A518DVR4_9BACT|nr:FMN-binding protein [Lignipirellula cremea]QDU95925.1 FMN-binding domain protein [Lignipirellula cremea]